MKLLLATCKKKKKKKELNLAKEALPVLIITINIYIYTHMHMYIASYLASFYFRIQSLLYIGIVLTYSVVLVSGMQQSGPVILCNIHFF